MFRKWQSFVLVLLAVHALSQGAIKARQPLSPDDLYRLEGPQTVVVSPGGQQAAMIRRWIDAPTRTERFSLWLMPGDVKQARALETDEPDARAPVYSPDGRWIAIRSTRPHAESVRPTPFAPPESDPATDIWLVASDGYGTGFAMVVSRELGLPASDPRLQRGVQWILTHQRESGKWFTRSPVRECGNRISNAGSAYAVLALQACGELPGWPLERTKPRIP